MGRYQSQSGNPAIYPQHILDIVINDNPSDNLSAGAWVMPSPAHFCDETEFYMDPSRPPETLGWNRVRFEMAIGPQGPIRMIQVDVPRYRPHLQELLTSCYCAALVDAVCYHEGIKGNPPQTIALPLLGTKSDGWPAHVSAECLLNAIHLFYENWFCHDHMPHKVFLCAEEKDQPELHALLKNRSLAFLSIPHHCGRYAPAVWMALRSHFIDPRFNTLTIDGFAAGCLERLHQMTGVAPALDAKGLWKLKDDVYIPVNYEIWLRLFLPALFQRFVQLWPEAVSNHPQPRLIPYDKTHEYKWLLPIIPCFDALLNKEIKC